MNRRGSILLEVLLAIAVFAFAGIVVLGVLGETADATARAERRAVAMDLACTRMAEIESGAEVALDPANAALLGLTVDDRREPCEFDGLELAVVEVRDTAGERVAVLRQLVRTQSPGQPRPEFAP